jgi:hypothetical protein
MKWGGTPCMVSNDVVAGENGVADVGCCTPVFVFGADVVSPVGARAGCRPTEGSPASSEENVSEARPSLNELALSSV